MEFNEFYSQRLCYDSRGAALVTWCLHKCRRCFWSPKKNVLQFLWRDLTSRFDVIGPYFTCAGSWDHTFLLECVMRTIQAFTLYNFHTRVLVCDGASSNLALVKLLCGYKHEQLPLSDGDDPFAVSASFENPHENDKNKKVFVLIYPSHQVQFNLYFIQYNAGKTYCDGLESHPVGLKAIPLCT